MRTNIRELLFSQHGKQTWLQWKLPPWQTPVKSFFIFIIFFESCEGRVADPAWRGACAARHAVCVRAGGTLPPCVEKDQWKKTAKLPGPRLRRQLGGQAGQKVAERLTATESMVFAFISSLSSSSAVALIPVNQTQMGGHLLADGSFCSERGCGRLAHSYGLSLIT